MKSKNSYLVPLNVCLVFVVIAATMLAVVDESLSNHLDSRDVRVYVVLSLLTLPNNNR